MDNIRMKWVRKKVDGRWVDLPEQVVELDGRVEYTVQVVDLYTVKVHKWFVDDSVDVLLAEYTIVYKKPGWSGRATCSCPAGRFRHRCRHPGEWRSYKMEDVCALRSSGRQ